MSNPWYSMKDDPENVGDVDEVVDCCDDLYPIELEECRVVNTVWVVKTFSEDAGTDIHEFDTKEEAEKFCAEQRRQAA